jgi:hypothetical protein
MKRGGEMRSRMGGEKIGKGETERKRELDMRSRE